MGRRISLVWTGDEKLRLRITITAWWDKLRGWERAELLLARVEGQLHAADVAAFFDVAADVHDSSRSSWLSLTVAGCGTPSRPNLVTRTPRLSSDTPSCTVCERSGAPDDDGRLHIYVVCQPSCRANAAVVRLEAARLEIAAALEEVQAAVVDALAAGRAPGS